MTHSLDSRRRLDLGAAYYPEHWPESRWPEDIRLMKDAGLTVVRMGEFAWSAMEPAEGEFDFDWLERAIELLAQAGIETVMGTPTAVPPAWLVEQHPDILATDETGLQVQFGNRCHYCVNSTEFHGATHRLVEAMAARFGDHPHVIGWQIDNEYNRVCYCDHCREQFHRFLRTRFGTLENLNERWATRYWSETYSAWEQIALPIGPHNPGLMLEFKHFITASYARFQKLQVDLLRPHLDPRIWITHNFMGWFDGFDHYQMTRDLDMASWDWYVGTGHHVYLDSGVMHDLVRGFKRRNFWLMETQPGHVNWSSLNSELNQGEMRVMAWHAVAHGAEGVLYWQWRPALGGQEQYHGSLVDQSGQPRPLFEEVRQIGQEFETVGELLAGTEIRSKVALLNCYDSRWSIHWQRHHKDFRYEAHFAQYYRPLAVRNLNVDVISADEPLDGYALVIAPALLILNEARSTHLKEFVRRGGSLVLTIRSGMKDEYNALLARRPPGPLSELAGVEVEDFYALHDPIHVEGDLFSGTSSIWAERLKILDPQRTQTLARYGICNGWLDGQPAVTLAQYGQGKVYFVGAYLDEASQDKLIESILASAGVEGIQLPENVDMHERTGDDVRSVSILLNHSQADQVIPWPWHAFDHLSRQPVRESLVLAPYGVAILTRLIE
jgi:beta-galactosidase